MLEKSTESGRTKSRTDGDPDGRTSPYHVPVRTPGDLSREYVLRIKKAVKDHVIKYSETAFSNSNVNYFWSNKNSSEVIEKLRLRNFRGFSGIFFRLFYFIHLIAT